MSYVHKKGDKVVLAEDLPQFNLFAGDSGTILEVFSGACAVYFSKWLHDTLPHKRAIERAYRYGKPAHAISKERLKPACMFNQ